MESKTSWASVSRMLGYLKYRANSAKEKDSAEDATQALQTYSSLSSIDKQHFLAEYERNKGSLKWARTFNARSVEKTSLTASTQEARSVSTHFWARTAKPV